MKKLGLVLVSVLALSGNVFASKTTNDSISTSWNGDINKSKLVMYLKVSSAQYDEIANICDFFKEQMQRANRADADDKKNLTRNAVYGNLKLMKKTLTEKQYADYVRLMAMTLRNKGIDIQK